MKWEKQIQLTGSLVFVLCLSAAVQAQIGTVRAHQKISDTEGGFTGLLEDDDVFGYVVSIGDLDGDDVSDLAVSAFRDDDGAYNAGAVYILFLNSDGTVKSHQKISELEGNFGGNLDSEDEFGQSLCCPGDINGDQIPDLAVGAWYDDDGDTNKGAVWILFLNSNGTVKAYQKISDTQGGLTGWLGKGDFFGSSVSYLGDFDGDGVNDLLVGACSDDDGGTDRGAAYILLLNSNGTVKSHYKISDTQGNFTGILDNSDRLGRGIAALGDLDGDAVTELAAGAYGDDDGGDSRGAVWILFMNPNGTVKNHQKISDTQGNLPGVLADVDLFGVFLRPLGDFDRDGIPDLVAGVAGDDGGFNRGAILLLLLNADGTVKTHYRISDTEGNFTGILDDNDWFSTPCSIGDINGDGITDLAVGTYADDDGGTNRGAVWILFLDGEVTFHVDGTNGNDNNNGFSRETAFKTIQKGIISASDSDTVLVWPGVYDMPSNFMGKAITVRSAADAAVLEAESNYAVSFYSGEGLDSVLENFVIRNCYAGIQAVGTSPTIRFVTVVNNDHGIIADITADPNISNSILWNNINDDLIDCAARYSCIQDGDPGVGNISVDPNFADRANGDFHLLSERGRYMPVNPAAFGGKEGFWVLDEVTSPCIDAADPKQEISGERMPNGGRANMGAYGGTAYASMSEWPLRADFNYDGIVNLADFVVVADEWLKYIDFDEEVVEPVYAWSQPSLLIPSTDIIMNSHPYVTADKLTMYYSQHNINLNQWDIVEATRQDPRGFFTATKIITELSGGLQPWLTENQLRMYYTFEEPSGKRILKIAERADLSSSWTPVREISEIHLSGYKDERPAVTADELTLFWASSRLEGSGMYYSIWQATRSSTAEPFSNVTYVSELNILERNSAPCISPDGLTIYYNSSPGFHPWYLYKATRNSMQEPFTNLQPFKMANGEFFDGHFPFVTPDEKDLYFWSNFMGQGEGIHVSYSEQQN